MISTGNDGKLTSELVLLLADSATWAQVDNIVKAAIDSDIDPLDLLPGLKSDRKQTIEIITSILIGYEASDAAEQVIEMMLAQANSANAIRGRNALIRMGVGCGEAILPYLKNKNWQLRQYFVQCLGIYQVPDLIPIFEVIQGGDKSSKVRDTAAQAIKFTLGEATLDECDLLPGMDEWETTLGVISTGE